MITFPFSTTILFPFHSYQGFPPVRKYTNLCSGASCESEGSYDVNPDPSTGACR